MTMQRSTLVRGVTGALLLAVLTFSACDFDAINTDPNNPTSPPINNVLPAAQMRIVFHVTGADPSWYSSVLVQHTAGVHAQLRDADQLRGLDATNLNTSWHFIYYALRDLNYVIEQAEEQDAWNYVGISKVLQAYTWQFATDIWGRIPYSEALQGSANLRPTYDNQQFIYQDLQILLDEAIADLARPSAINAGSFDLLYNGNAEAWTRAAYALKARLHNRTSKRNPTASAEAALQAAAQAFTSNAHDLTFTRYSNNTIHQHPWWRERGDRAHHAWGTTMDNIMVQYNDPRREIFAQPMPNGDIVPAPNTQADSDQAGALYSKMSENIIYPTAHQPLITYAEIEFIRADAYNRLGQHANARAALEAGIRAAMDARSGQADIPTSDVDAYIAEPGVIPADNAMLHQRIAEEKWIMLFPFQSVEAWAEWRRTGYPTLVNAFGPIPRRMHYPQREYDTNAENVPLGPNDPLTIGGWWDTGTEN
jgi:hypothetical protein